MQGRMSANATQRQEGDIPTVVYRTWIDLNLLPGAQKAWRLTQTHNPTFEQKLFTHEQRDAFMQNETSDRVWKAYARINPRYGAARADLFRYAILYERGGFYLDAKSWAGDLKRLPKDGFLLTRWGEGDRGFLCRVASAASCRDGEWVQWFLGAAPKHPVLAEVLHRVCRAIETYSEIDYPPSKNSVLRLTGPLIFTEAVDFCLTKGVAAVHLLPPIAGGVVHYRTSIHEEEMRQAGITHYSRLKEPIVSPRSNNSSSVASRISAAE